MSQTNTELFDSVPVSDCRHSTLNVRQNRTAEDVERLAERIRRHGFDRTRPLWCLDGGDCAAVFAGGTRLEAARLAGLESVPVLVHRGLSDEEIHQLSALDNENDATDISSSPLERTDLVPLHEHGNEVLALGCRQIAEAKSVEDLKEIRDRAQAFQYYARRQELGLQAMNDGAEIKLRADRRIGELLAGMPKHPAGRPTENPSHDARDLPPRLVELGVTYSDSHRCQRMASVPDEHFERHIAEVRSAGEELTTAGVLRLARRLSRPEKEDTPPLPPGVYDVILADPPWDYEFSETEQRAIENQYPPMPLEEIRALEVPAADNAVLFLWATAPKLEEALSVLHAWGFSYKTGAVWDKEKIGMGYWFRGQHELLLVGTRGTFSPPEPANRPPSVLRETRGEHSAKPECVYRAIEAMFPHARRLEVFARRPREGWTVWGNEVSATTEHSETSGGAT